MISRIQLLSVLVFSGIVLFFLFTSSPGQEEEKMVDVIDISLSEPQSSLLSITLGLNRKTDISGCRLDAGGIIYEYSSESSWVTENANRLIELDSQDMELTPKEHAVSASPATAPDMDRDGKDDKVFVCTSQVCPSAYASRYIAFNLSSSKNLKYVPLYDNEGIPVDLSKPWQKIDTGLVFCDDYQCGIRIKGITSEVPNVLGFGKEDIHFLRRPHNIGYDLDNNGFDDYYGYYFDELVYLPGKGKQMSMDSIKEGFGLDKSYALNSEGLYPKKLFFTAQSLYTNGTMPALIPGDVVVIKVPLLEGTDTRRLSIRMDCNDFMHEVDYVFS